jgi:hypothetical protein
MYVYTFGLFSTVAMLHDEERSILFFSRGPHLIFTLLPNPRAHNMVKRVRWARSISASKIIWLHDRDIDACFDVQSQQGWPASFLGH